MFFLYGRDEIVRGVYTVSSMGEVCVVDNLTSLRNQYLRFLSDPKFDTPVNFSDNLFVTDQAIEDAISAAFSRGHLDDMQQEKVIGQSFADTERVQRIEKVGQAVSALRASDVALAQIFDLIIHSLLIKGTNRLANGSAAHGGSSSNAIGAIWLSVNDGLQLNDLVELLIHELTHHLLFIDEYRFYHFEYDLLGKPENFAISAIRNTMRPLDKVVHSIVVAAELLAARRNLEVLSSGSTSTVHPTSSVMANDTIRACDSVFALTNLSALVTDRTVELVRLSRAVCTDSLALV